MRTITLTQPITVNGTKTSTIVMRPPVAGDLRGLKMVALAQMDTDAVLSLVPRIAVEPVTKDALDTLVAADLLALCVGVSDFFDASTTPSPMTP